MTIEFLGHAGFLVDCGSATVLCDPWFSPFGAYAGSWYPFPSNSQIDLEALERATHLYISHWHEDHLDEWFLSGRSEAFKRSVVVLIPKFKYPRLREAIAHCGYTNILEIEDEYVRAGGIRIYIQRDENPLYSDSSIVIASGGDVFVNSNDCKLTIGQEEEIVKRFGPVTFYTAQFSGATFHPTCYEYPLERKIEISRARREAKFERIARSAERLGANAYIPSAGPACFLDRELFSLNLNPATVFSGVSDFYEWLQPQSRKWNFVELAPGERIDRASHEERRAAPDYETPAYLDSYANDRAAAIADRLRDFACAVPDLPRAAREHFRDKLLDVPALARRANVLLEVHLERDRFYVDTFAGNVSDAKPRALGRQSYTLELSEFWMRALVAKKIRWEDLILSFRFSISREPDVYNEAFIAFLQLDTGREREDYVRFLERLDRRDRERVRRVHQGVTIEYDRFCPHNCEDLSNAKIEDGVLTCPRHFWRFSLEDGRGLNNLGCIHLEHIPTFEETQT